MRAEELRVRFNQLRPRYDLLKDQAKFILEQGLQKSGLQVVYPIQCRIKEFDQFLKKAEQKQCEDPFEEIHDICGLRVVCYLRSGMEPIASIIRERFSVIEEDNKVEGLDFSSSAYSAIHFVVEMKESYAGPPYDDIAHLKFEVQLLTIAMHAWASVSHYLDYKSDIDAPSELKKDFRALSALFYLADTHFERFAEAREQSRQQTLEAFRKAEIPVDAEINLDTLSAYLRERFPERTIADPKYVSALVSNLLTAGYKSMAEISQTVERALDAMLEVEKMYRVRFGDGESLSADQALRIAVDLANPGFHAVAGTLAPPDDFVKLVKTV